MHSVQCRHIQFALLRSDRLHSRSAGSTSGSDGHRRRLPRPVRSPCPGVCSASGASTYSTASGLIRTPTVLATPSVSAPFHLQPRRVRSRSRVSQAGRFELYFCGQFSVCLFRIRGREPRSIFPLAKVGLTVQRKIYLTDFFLNFYQSPPYRSYCPAKALKFYLKFLLRSLSQFSQLLQCKN